MLKSLIFLLFIPFTLLSESYAQNKQDSVKVDQVYGDGDVNYSKRILLNGEFDFKLNRTQPGKFIISFYKNENKPVVIKIYDITGNLIKQETVVENGAFSKEYNLSYYKPSFFVVEVGSSKYNKTKSIMAE